LILLASCQDDEQPTTGEPVATEVAVAAESNPTAVAILPPTLPPPANNSDETTNEAQATTAVVPEQTTGTPTSIPQPNTPEPNTVPETAVTSNSLTPIVNGGLTRPVYLTHAGDERLFVLEQRGLIRIIENGQLLAQPFLDIEARVGDTSNEQGLLSVAFAPAYSSNGRFFVNYTNNNGDTVISRFQVSSDPNTADPDSELILLTIPQPFGNHNGGQLQFGPDGYLYIGMGDGGSQGDPQDNGQNPNTLLGGILRLDVNQEPYGSPANNPFANQTARSEMWAIGLRNPWRFSFDRLTGDLFIADVGQNTWEEINFQPANSSGGENYGWNILEGNHCYQGSNCATDGLQAPIFEYDHNFGCSITGGYVYRGQQFPELSGNYFVADYCTGIIWSLFHEANGTWTNREVLRSNLVVSSFGEDVQGELYVIDHNGGVWGIRP
jgi:glucose/arabinose dehydrogenase